MEPEIAEPFIPNLRTVPILPNPQPPQPPTRSPNIPTTTSLSSTATTTTSFYTSTPPATPSFPYDPPGLPKLPSIGGFIVNVIEKTTQTSSKPMLTTSGGVIPDDNATEFPVRLQLCGNPGFCSNGVYDVCSNQTLNQCERCDVGSAVVFIIVVILLGLAIILGNVLITVVGYRRYKNRKAENINMDLCKTSLAVADSLTGIQILTVVIYNFSRTITATPEELLSFELSSRDSGGAFFAGVLYMFGFTSSVFHLCFMGSLRLVAVAFPLRYKFMRDRTIVICLVGVWLLSAIAATMPGWFPKNVYFAFQVSLLLFFPTLASLSDFETAYAMISILYVTPYVLMTIFSIVTAILIHFHENKRRRRVRKPDEQEKISKEEIAIFITMLVMQVAFTLAMIPTVVLIVLFYTETLDCSRITIPYIVCVYISMTNSLVNVFIYNIRDSTFREMSKQFLGSMLPRIMQKDPEKGSKSQQHESSKPTSGTNTSTPQKSINNN